MEERETAITSKEDDTSKKGIYLYCITEGSNKLDFGQIGVDGNRVYTIPYRDLLAVVHDCRAAAYDSQDEEMVKKWVVAHQKIVNHAWGRSGTVLPLSFDTIIRGEEKISPEQNVIRWLESDYERLKEKIDKVRGKSEYGVQISWDPKIIAAEIIEEVPEIKKLNDEIKTKSSGTAYLYEEKLKSLLKKEMEKRADIHFKEFYAQIRPQVDDIKIEKAKKTDDELQMLMNLSCLVVRQRVSLLGDALEKIQAREGFSVRFTGPWAPYSFV